MKDRRQPPFTPGHPGDWKRSRARNRPGRGLWALALAVFAVAAGLGYLLWRDLQQPPDAPQGSMPAPAAAASKASAPAGRGADRADRILSCTAPDGTVFYTNAASCSAADLDNRVNVLPARESGDGARPGRCLSEQEGVAHQFLPACQEQFREALEVERYLSRAEDPLQSRRAREYCDLIAQGVNNGCLATSDTFCYLHVCQQLVEQGR